MDNITRLSYRQSHWTRRREIAWVQLTENDGSMFIERILSLNLDHEFIGIFIKLGISNIHRKWFNPKSRIYLSTHLTWQLWQLLWYSRQKLMNFMIRLWILIIIKICKSDEQNLIKITSINPSCYRDKKHA